MAAGLKLVNLRQALGELTPDVEDDRASVAEWTAHDHSTITVDLLLPLLVLARDIKQFDESGEEVVLDGA